MNAYTTFAAPSTAPAMSAIAALNRLDEATHRREERLAMINALACAIEDIEGDRVTMIAVRTSPEAPVAYGVGASVKMISGEEALTNPAALRAVIDAHDNLDDGAVRVHRVRRGIDADSEYMVGTSCVTLFERATFEEAVRLVISGPMPFDGAV